MSLFLAGGLCISLVDSFFFFFSLEISSLLVESLLMLNVILLVSVSQKDLCSTLLSFKLKCQVSVSGCLFQSDTNVRQLVPASACTAGSKQLALD